MSLRLKTKSDMLTVIVRDSAGEEKYCRMKYSTSMSMLFQKAAEMNGVQEDSLRFLINGKRIPKYSTPASLKMKDGEKINMLLEQVGC